MPDFGTMDGAALRVDDGRGVDAAGHDGCRVLGLEARQVDARDARRRLDARLDVTLDRRIRHGKSIVFLRRGLVFPDGHGHRSSSRGRTRRLRGTRRKTNPCEQSSP